MTFSQIDAHKFYTFFCYLKLAEKLHYHAKQDCVWSMTQNCVNEFLNQSDLTVM